MSFQYLRVYQAAELLDTLIIALVATIPRGFAKDIDQLLRASASVVYNIAEAHGLEQPGKKRNHLDIARGSVDETRAILRRLVRRGALSGKAIQRCSALSITVAKMLTAWIATID